jgi:hypothetical protein
MIFVLSMSASGRAEVMAGPTLVHEGGIWQSTGLYLEAVRNVTLVSVRYPNQGLGAVVELRNEASSVLVSVDVVGTPNTAFASVLLNYPLTAGTRYKLIAVSPNNSRFASFSSFPQENDDIRVLSSWSAFSDPAGAANTMFWMAFNDLETSEPSHVDAATWSKIKGLYR